MLRPETVYLIKENTWENFCNIVLDNFLGMIPKAQSTKTKIDSGIISN